MRCKNLRTKYCRGLDEMEYEIVSASEVNRSITTRAAFQLLKPKRKQSILPDTALLYPGVKLEKDKVEAFSKVCGYHPEQGVPVTFPYILGFPLQMSLMLRSDFPFPVVGLVFLANSIKQHEALNTGQTMSVSVKTGSFLRHDKGQAFTLETSLITNGRTVWECTSTYLRRGIKSPKGADYLSLPSDPLLNDVKETWDLPANLGKQYAKVSGDTNPIHTSALGAKLLGFKRAIAHGMWCKARILASILPNSPVTKLEVDVNFKKPVFLPGTVSALYETQKKQTIFELRDLDNEQPHLRGQLLF